MPSDFAGHAAAEQGGNADGVLSDDGHRAGQHARPTGAAEQLVLHPGRSRVASGRRRHMAACLVRCFAVPGNGSRHVVTAFVT